MLWWPAALQLTFFITAILSATQATMLRKPWFRNLVGVQPLPESVAPKPQSQNSSRFSAPSSASSNSESSTGLFGGIKGAVSDFMKAAAEKQRAQQQGGKSRLTVAEKRHAKAYDDKRQKEMVEEAAVRRKLAQAKFEREQEQVVKDQERAERLKRRAGKKASRQV